MNWHRYMEKDSKLSSRDSDGAFDPTIGKIIRLWDIGGENTGIPEQEELDKLLKETGYEKLELDGNKVTLKRRSDSGCWEQQERESDVTL